MRNSVISIFLVVFLSIQAAGTNYYVSPSGDDDNDGLAPGTAWQTIDNGDQDYEDVLEPGDTVNILPGTYSIWNSIELKTPGTHSEPITYHKLGEGDVEIDGTSVWEDATLFVIGSHIVVEGLEIVNSYWDGIIITGDSNTVTSCYIHDITTDGIDVGGADKDACGNLLLRNIVAFCGESGIENDNPAQNNTYYGNTVYECTYHGFYLKDEVTTARIFNNIVSSNYHGIYGTVENVCGFNNVWGNVGGNYFNGVTDSAGGISKLPKFEDPDNGQFELKSNAFEIDAGLDLGYPYNGLAPDMGALETSEVAYIDVVPSVNTVIELTSSQYSVNGYDSDSNLVKDCSNSVDWSTTDPAGSVKAAGLYWAGNQVSPPDYYVKAIYCDTLSDSGRVSVIASLDYIKIECADGSPFDDTTLITDNDTTKLYEVPPV